MRSIFLLASAVCAERKDVLLLLADDLRADVLQPAWRTPHLGKLATQSTVFASAYAQIAVCCPSRNSFLTGAYADAVRVYGKSTSFRDTCGAGVVTLPGFFKSIGYTVRGGGKVFHVGRHGPRPPNHDGALSWSPGAYHEWWKDVCRHNLCVGDRLRSPKKVRPPKASSGKRKQRPQSARRAIARKQRPKSAKSAIARKQRPQSAKRERPDYGVADRRLVEAGDNFFDAGLARFGANLVGEVAAAPERFFVALGFRQPHLPWMATRPLWDSYNATDRPPIAAPRRTYQVPRGMPDLAYSDSNANFNFGSYGHHYQNAGPGHPMPRADAAVARRGAAAAITHLDGCIGEVLAALDASPRANTTLVVFTSDHGYHYGEQGSWSKHTLFEAATRVPFLVRAPWLETHASRPVATIVELIDLYRTIVTLVAPDAVGRVADAVRGRDRSRLVGGGGGGGLVGGGGCGGLVGGGGGDDGDDDALSAYPRCYEKGYADAAARGQLWSKSDCGEVVPADIDVMGYSLRTRDWRYTLWLRWAGDHADWSEKGTLAVELYDLRRSGSCDADFDDFDDFERENVADAHAHVALRARLRARLAGRVADSVARRWPGCSTTKPGGKRSQHGGTEGSGP
mmetsp:Transcript_14601/g.45228  ORF Transcript_14601/g.45228 Transcript_14601/m.45228 type:complete len:625 (-) Transcript_14601:33-1907(-)